MERKQSTFDRKLGIGYYYYSVLYNTIVGRAITGWNNLVKQLNLKMYQCVLKITTTDVFIYLFIHFPE